MANYYGTDRYSTLFGGGIAPGEPGNPPPGGGGQRPATGNYGFPSSIGLTLPNSYGYPLTPTNIYNWPFGYNTGQEDTLGGLNFPNAGDDWAKQMQAMGQYFPYAELAAQNKLANAQMANENQLNWFDRSLQLGTTQWQQQAASAEFARDVEQMGVDNAYRKWQTMGYEIDAQGNVTNPTLEYQKLQADQWASLMNAQLQSGALQGLAPEYDPQTGEVIGWKQTLEGNQQGFNQNQTNLQNYLTQLASRGLAATIDPTTGLPTSESANLAGQEFKRNSRNLWASMYGQDLGLNAEGQLNQPTNMNTQAYRQMYIDAYGYDPGAVNKDGLIVVDGDAQQGLTGAASSALPGETLAARQQNWSQNFQTQNAANDWLAQQAGLTGMFNGAPTQSMQQQQWAQNTQFPEQMKAQKEQAAWASFGRQFAPNARWL